MKKNDISAERMMNERLDFIVKSFNHTHKKKYENYVVTGIWHRLRAKNLMIKPITQQLVRRPDGKYALLDLYFPAINLAVECDENQHFDPNGNYIPEDKLREYDVLKVLAALPIQPELMRIKAVCGLTEIDQQLDHVVEAIEKRIAGVPASELWNDESAAEFVTKNRMLNVSDPVLFSLKRDILNALEFRKPNGEEYAGLQQGTYKVGSNEEFWFANLIRQMGEGRYTNVWHEETEEIHEYESEGKENNWPELIRQGAFFRYTFCRVKDALGNNGFKFYGKFKLASEIRHDSQGRYLIWKKVGDEIRIDEVNPGKGR